MKINVIRTQAYTVISADIPSKSRLGLYHYTRIIINNNGKILGYTCDCEAFAMKKECWHVRFLKKYALRLIRNH